MTFEIVKNPDKRLRHVSTTVVEFDRSLASFLDELAETMYVNHGVGLAAPQVGVPIRAFVIDTTDGYDLREFVNPSIVLGEGLTMSTEGCLSIPSVVKNRKRFESIVVKAFDRTGNEFEQRLDGLLAIVFQHENDHLSGVLMVD